eukprot:1818520-Rhodomonas_salina.1
MSKTQRSAFTGDGAEHCAPWTFGTPGSSFQVQLAGPARVTGTRTTKRTASTARHLTRSDSGGHCSLTLG